MAWLEGEMGPKGGFLESGKEGDQINSLNETSRRMVCMAWKCPALT